jgi:hypothetical protein
LRDKSASHIIRRAVHFQPAVHWPAADDRWKRRIIVSIAILGVAACCQNGHIVETKVEEDAGVFHCMSIKAVESNIEPYDEVTRHSPHMPYAWIEV